MPNDTTTLLRAALPVATAIGVFGVIYGALATSVMSPALVVASSLLMFSGAAQFALLGLLEVDATNGAMVVAVTVLGLRHIPLAAIVRPRLQTTRSRRGLLALALTDETVGLALAAPRKPARTIAIAGILAWVAFGAGTLAGVLGANLVALEPLAATVLLLLFVGLSSMTSRGRRDRRTAVASGVATIVVLTVFPTAGAMGAIGMALVIAALPFGPTPTDVDVTTDSSVAADVA